MKDETAATWAERFWARAGPVEPFPRDLESAVAWALPLAIVKLPRLTLEQARIWLKSRGVIMTTASPDRALRACLVARGGRGFVLLEGSDPAAERRMSLAHEVAHFLLDYMDPREAVLALLGESARAVVDGDRPATTGERLAGVLRGIHVGTYTHLMRRSNAGLVDRVAVVEAEDRADRLALELLAPRRAVLRNVVRKLPPRSAAHTALTMTESVLIDHFGLPRAPARRYARVLAAGLGAPRSFSEWIRP